MAKKKPIKVRSSLGRGLDSLIPIINEEKESKSLEELLDNDKDEPVIADIPSEKEYFEKKSPEEDMVAEEEVDKTTPSSKELEIKEELIEEPKVENVEEETLEEIDNNFTDTPMVNSSETVATEDSMDTDKKLILSELELKSKEDVLEIIAENPRITLWSARSAAVLRYLRKTKPEFSISKESSTLIDEAIKEKYPEIWALFEDL
ncbi:MAG: hypothetical protein ACRCVG_03655 [Methanobacteriaceae archaeon]